jgi:hypothetical protein
VACFPLGLINPLQLFPKKKQKRKRKRRLLNMLAISTLINFKIVVVKPKKQICNFLVIAHQGGQKNRSGKTTTVLFYHLYY